MDDYPELSPTVEAKRKAQDLVEMIAKDGFTLTKFVSNVHDVLSTLNLADKPTNGNVKALAVEGESSLVFGLNWNYPCDNLVVSR